MKALVREAMAMYREKAWEPSFSNRCRKQLPMGIIFMGSLKEQQLIMAEKPMAYTVPNPNAQAEVIGRAIKEAQE